MRKVPAAILSLLAFVPVFSALPAKAASTAMPTPAQAECAAVNPSKGEEKFTGQISGGPTGTSIEVTSGSQSVLVNYSNSVTVCQGGQPASVNVLTRGANVVVYGPMKRKGKVTEMTAAKILIAGSPQAGMRGGDAMSTSNGAMPRGGTQPVPNIPNNGGSDPVPNIPNNGASQTSNSNADHTGSVVGSGRSNAQNSGAITCSALLFGVTTTAEASGAGAHASGRPSVSGISCKRPVDQLALQLAQDALTRRRLSSVTLNWQNQLEASMTNAEITSVQFMSDNGTQVVEITYAYQKAEVVHLPSGTRVSF